MITLPAVSVPQIGTMIDKANQWRQPFVIDDSSAAFVSTNNNTVGGSGFTFQVFDYSGKWTYFSSGYIPGSINDFVFVPLGNGKFIAVCWNASGGSVFSFLFQVANLKINNKVPILINKNMQILTNPCYNLNLKIRYDALNKYLGVAYYDPTAQFGGLCVSSTYLVGDGLSLISQGFVGNYISGTSSDYDPYDLLNNGDTSYKIVSNTNANQTNGYNSNVGYRVSDSSYFIAGNLFVLNPGLNTDCSTPSGANAAGIVKPNFFVNNTSNEFTNQFDTNIPGFIGALNPANYYCQFFDKYGFGAQFYYGNAPWAALTRQHFFCSTSIYNVYCGTVSVPLNLGTFANNTPRPLANFSHIATNIAYRSQ